MTHDDAPFSVFLPCGILQPPLAISRPPSQGGVLKEDVKNGNL